MVYKKLVCSVNAVGRDSQFKVIRIPSSKNDVKSKATKRKERLPWFHPRHFKRALHIEFSNSYQLAVRGVSYSCRSPESSSALSKEAEYFVTRWESWTTLAWTYTDWGWEHVLVFCRHAAVCFLCCALAGHGWVLWISFEVGPEWNIKVQVLDYVSVRFVLRDVIVWERFSVLPFSQVFFFFWCQLKLKRVVEVSKRIFKSFACFGLSQATFLDASTKNKTGAHNFNIEYSYDGCNKSGYLLCFAVKIAHCSWDVKIIIKFTF